MPEKRKRSLKRKILLSVLLLFVIGIGAFLIYFRSVAIEYPPIVKDTLCLQLQRIKVAENTYTYGNNWLRKSESGLWEMYIEGKPFDRGVAFGRLTKELLEYQEQTFVDQINEIVPSKSYLSFLKYFVAWFDRNLDQNIVDEYKEEIYGVSLSASHAFDFIGSGYQRQLNYHAAHDIGHALQGLNMVGCTSFSFWNSKSADSSLVVGRNFDFYVNDKFAENKIICFYNPSAGYKFMMVSWPCMTGVVSGMNEKGLTITINAAKSSIPTSASTPVTLLTREILQYASTIDEAYAIAKKRKLFVSESLMIGSLVDNKTAIIEKSPEKEDIFFSDTSYIICANHFQGTVFANDKTNLKNIKESDSNYRFRRAAELMAQNPTMDVTKTAAILRNRDGIGGVDAGMGNETINQLIAHHAVIFKPSKLLVWVSAPPYQLGKFVAYDLNKIFQLDKKKIAENKEIYEQELTIPADSFLYSTKYQDYLLHKKQTHALKQYKEKKEALPQNFIRDYIVTNPKYYQTYVKLAEYFEKRSLKDSALNYYAQALNYEVPKLAERENIEKRIQKLKK
jgi:isopenicillin-N N-acyltransferase like protein